MVEGLWKWIWALCDWLSFVCESGLCRGVVVFESCLFGGCAVKCRVCERDCRGMVMLLGFGVGTLLIGIPVVKGCSLGWGFFPF